LKRITKNKTFFHKISTSRTLPQGGKNSKSPDH